MTLKRARLKSTLPKAATWSLEGSPVTLPATPTTGSAGGQRNGDRREGPVSPMMTTSKRRIQRAVAPLNVLQQPIQAGVRKVFDLRRFILVIVLTGGVLLLPIPPGLSPEGHRALALFMFTGAILALEPAPLPIAALLVPICQIALGIDEANGAFAPFGQPTVFMVLGSLFLAEALRKHGLTRRLAMYAIANSSGNFPQLLLGLMVITAALSMWVLNTAIAAVLIPVAITIAQRIQPAEVAQRALAVLVLSIAYASSIGGIATVMGSNENAIATGLLSGELGYFGFLDWMKYGFPVVLLLLPLSWFVLLKVIPVRNATIDLDPVHREIERAGALTSAEREIIGVFLISVTLWISGKSLERWFFLPETLLSSAVVALGAVALLSIEELIDWNDLKGVNWGVFFVIGAGLTLGDALSKTKADEWFAGLLAPLLQGMPYLTILTALVVVGFVMTQFMNNVTLGAILAPILVTVAKASAIEPTRLVIPTIFAVALSYILPVASARMTLVAVTGAVERKEMVRAGIWVGIPSALVIIGFFYLLSIAGMV
jgi:solute carrier family 13 (sodium-dependent dicarboxylate transporter), member 2/3/5